MKRALEFSVFVGIAFALHVAVGFGAPETGGDAGGTGGEAFVTLQGSNAQIRQLVTEWTKQPEHQTDVSQPPHSPEIETQSPALPVPAPELPLRAKEHIAALPPTPTTAAPQLDRQSAQPRPAPAPKPVQETRPEPAPQPAPDPQAEPATPQAATPSQRAAGSGGTTQSGNSGKAKALGNGQDAKQVAQWGAKIRSQIERNKRLPRGVRGTGVTHVRIQVAPNGRLLSAKIIKSSGISAYDQAALGAVKRAGRFAKAPRSLTAKSYSFRFSLRFTR